jgi:hypothetical protein
MIRVLKNGRFRSQNITLQSGVLIVLSLIVMPITDGIFLFIRSPLVAISFGSSQQFVGVNASSSYDGESRLCRGDVGMAGTGAAEESRW